MLVLCFSATYGGRDANWKAPYRSARSNDVLFSSSPCDAAIGLALPLSEPFSLAIVHSSPMAAKPLSLFPPTPPLTYYFPIFPILTYVPSSSREFPTLRTQQEGAKDSSPLGCTVECWWQGWGHPEARDLLVAQRAAADRFGDAWGWTESVREEEEEETKMEISPDDDDTSASPLSRSLSRSLSLSFSLSLSLLCV